MLTGGRSQFTIHPQWPESRPSQADGAGGASLRVPGHPHLRERFAGARTVPACRAHQRRRRLLVLTSRSGPQLPGYGPAHNRQFDTLHVDPRQLREAA